MLELPLPAADAAALSQSLAEIIDREIQRDGPLSLARFWELTQYHPTLGYYHNGLHKFGAGGDFVTAPEMGDVFGRCVANWLGPALAALESPSATVLEAGAGSGALAATVLQALDESGQLPDRYLILEVSGELRDRQRQTLSRTVSHLLPRVRWLDQPPDQPWDGIVLGNEVVDALPASRFRFQGDGWQEMRVTRGTKGFQWQAHECAKPPGVLPASLPAGYLTEVQERLPAWINTLLSNLRQGAVWLADYGYVASEYFHPQRVGGTALAHYRQRAHDDLLAWPGLQDLSVNVNFSQLAEALTNQGLNICGFTSQAQFLLESGLPQQIEAAQALDDQARWARMQQVKRLTLPSEMGERFSVLIASRELELPAPTFDQRGRL